MQKQYVISLEPPHSPIAGCEESCIAVYLADEVDARIAKLEEVAGMALGVLNAGIPISPRSVIHDEIKSLLGPESP